MCLCATRHTGRVEEKTQKFSGSCNSTSVAHTTRENSLTTFLSSSRSFLDYIVPSSLFLSNASCTFPFFRISNGSGLEKSIKRLMAGVGRRGGGGCRLIVPNTWKYFEGGLRGRIEEQGHHECPPRNSILLAWKQRAILYSIPEPTSLKHCEGERRRRINVVLALYIWL